MVQRRPEEEKKESDDRCCAEATETVLAFWNTTRRCWQRKGKAERSNGAVRVSQGFCFLAFQYLVLDLNFFPKAISSSGTDRVRVKEPSDSDLTTRA